MIKWIIEEHAFGDDNPQKMMNIIKLKGMEAVPYSEGIHPTKDECVIVYGSINLALRLLKTYPCNPTAWMNLQNLNCQAYYAHWGEHILQREYVILPWAELPRSQNVLSWLEINGNVFIRPDNNIKTFPGECIKLEDFMLWYKIINETCKPSPELLTVVAKPQDILREWRLVVADSQVITGSQYRLLGAYEEDTKIPNEAIDFANKIALHDWQPDKIYILDVCLVSGHKGELSYKVVEIGSVNTAGLYSCDLEKVVDVMSNLALKECAELYEEN